MTQEVKLRRTQCNYQPEGARFLLDCDFSKQYDHYYRKRLEKTRPYVEFNCRSKWDPTIPIYNLAEVANFSIQSRSDDGSDLGSFSSLSPPDIKRFRKLSQTVSPLPRSSTQQQQQACNASFLDNPLGEQFTSPIAGQLSAQEILSSRSSPVIRRHEKSRRAECIIIGTIFKRMKLQPDVVEELSKGDFHVKCERYPGHYTSQDDTLVLEDFEESIQLVGNINPKQFVTGIVVALLGVSIDDGSQFLVYDVCFAEPNLAIVFETTRADSGFDILPPEVAPKDSRPVYLLLVSGLGFHHEMGKRSSLTKALQEFIDFIWGGGRYEDDPRSSRVARILVLGNCLSADRLTALDVDDSQGVAADEIAIRMKQSRQVKPYCESILATKHMDDFFAQLSKTIYVDVMPGPEDPSSHLMPQQPFHPCMFPKSCMFSTFNCVPNPQHAIYHDSVDVLATSGQNVDIVGKFSGLSDPLDIMKCHLLWGNMAPNAPDNLYSAPYEDEDPYVIDFIPSIYVAGCQKEFRTCRYQYTSSDPVETRNQQQHDSARSSRYTESDVINVTPDSVITSNLATKIPDSSCSTPKATRRSRRIEADDSLLNSTPKIVGAFETRCRDASQLNRHESSSRAKKDSTLLITVPEFYETFSCVLVELNSLETELLSFQ